MKSGASAFVLQTDVIHEFRPAITAVLGGHRYISQGALERLLDRHIDTVRPKTEESKLTTKQAKVVELVSQGLSNKEIATRLTISESTVEKHRTNAMRRIGVRTFADLMRYAFATGLASSNVNSQMVNPL